VSNSSASSMDADALPVTRADLQEAARADVVQIVGAPGSRAGSAGAGTLRVGSASNVAAASPDAGAGVGAASPDEGAGVGAASPDAGAGVGAGAGTSVPSPPPSPPPFQARRGSSPPRVQHDARVSGATPRRPWSGATLPPSPPGSSGNDAASDAFNCPIGHTVMTDPVTCADGHSYQVKAEPRPYPFTLTPTLAPALTLSMQRPLADVYPLPRTTAPTDY
jgi:hypothetical protein